MTSPTDAQIEAVARALDPFARLARIMDALTHRLSDDTPLREIAPGIWPTLGDCRKANDVLRAYEQSRKEPSP